MYKMYNTLYYMYITQYNILFIPYSFLQKIVKNLSYMCTLCFSFCCILDVGEGGGGSTGENVVIEENVFAFLTETGSLGARTGTDSEWLFDGGCTVHLIASREYFIPNTIRKHYTQIGTAAKDSTLVRRDR